MLQQIEFKLSVEKQYKEGIDKMINLYQIEGDRRSKAEAEAKKVESTQKIQLLTKSRKRYNDMNIDFDEDEDNDDENTKLNSNIRRPLTGNLQISILAVKDVDHIVGARPIRGPESYLSVKVEDQIRARTRYVRNDRWNEEFNISVDKANEIEIAIYDKVNDQNIPVGLMWLRISDIAEAIRRRRVEQELSQTGWVSASKVQDNATYPGGSAAGSGFHPAHSAGPHADPTQQPPAPATPRIPSGVHNPSNITIDSWFVLEPAGQIHLALNFEKASRGTKRPYDGIGGLGRQGAIRQKKEEVHEMHGHQFVQHQFYNVMKCAYCGDFLKYAGGYQCMDCKYTCHKKCYPNVVTKCISRASNEVDPDEEKLNHRIPHRFEPYTNMGANWCCHCGYLLPLGKKNVRKCTECGSTCHASCVHLVPDFCGMSNEVANKILREIKKTKHRKAASVGSIETGRPRVNSASPRFDYGYGSGNQSPLSPARPPKSPQHLVYQNQNFQQQQRQQSPYLDQQNVPQLQKIQQLQGQPDQYEHYQQQDYQQQQQQQQQQEQKQKQKQKTYDLNKETPLPPIPIEGQESHQSIPSEPLSSTTAEPAGLSPQFDFKESQNVNPLPAASAVMSSLRPQRMSVEIPSLRPQTPPTAEPALQDQIQFNQLSQDDQSNRKSLQLSPDRRQVSPSQHQHHHHQQRKKKKVGLDDFNFLAVLGKGNFGKVMLAESRQTQSLYAIKVLKKDFIIENEEVESTRSEKRVFLIANKEHHPFLLNLHSCFQTENRIYFVMDYVSGGDLMWHIQQIPFTPRRAQFYAAEVLLGLKYFHDNGVIYRDLKLDNILLTLSGHIKIADYGLCKEDMWYGKTTGTFCGTPEFMAPEILLEQKYGRGVDWWAFGVLIYQMLLGQSPFRGEDDDEVFDAILLDEPLYPIHMPRDSVSILQGLLIREPEKRLGSSERDALDIMEHDYFKNINFDDIYHCRVPPPYVPKIDSPTDVANFDQEFTSEVPALTPVTKTLTPAMQEKFRGFSYLNGDIL